MEPFAAVLPVAGEDLRMKPQLSEASCLAAAPWPTCFVHLCWTHTAGYRQGEAQSPRRSRVQAFMPSPEPAWWGEVAQILHDGGKIVASLTLLTHEQDDVTVALRAWDRRDSPSQTPRGGKALANRSPVPSPSSSSPPRQEAVCLQGM